MKCVSDEARVPRQASEARNLAIRRYATGRDTRDRIVYAPVGTR
jgi:hypothetical protein